MTQFVQGTSEYLLLHLKCKQKREEGDKTRDLIAELRKDQSITGLIFDAQEFRLLMQVSVSTEGIFIGKWHDGIDRI